VFIRLCFFQYRSRTIVKNKHLIIKGIRAIPATYEKRICDQFFALCLTKTDQGVFNAAGVTTTNNKRNKTSSEIASSQVLVCNCCFYDLSFWFVCFVFFTCTFNVFAQNQEWSMSLKILNTATGYRLTCYQCSPVINCKRRHGTSQISRNPQHVLE